MTWFTRTTVVAAIFISQTGLLLFLPGFHHSSSPAIFRLFLLFSSLQSCRWSHPALRRLKSRLLFLSVLLQCLLCQREHLVLPSHQASQHSHSLHIHWFPRSKQASHLDAPMCKLFSIELQHLLSDHPIHHFDLPFDIQVTHLISLNLSGTACSIYHHRCAGWPLEYITSRWTCNLIMHGENRRQR